MQIEKPAFNIATYKIQQTQLFINNEFVNSASGKTFPTENPATQEIICHVAQAGEEDANKAIAAARAAFDKGPWRKMSGYERGRLMYKLADLLEAHADEFAYLESIDNGKPMHIARDVDVVLAVKCLRYYAGWADKIPGHLLNLEGPYHGYIRPEPVGVCAQIIPWNFPLLMLAWKWGPLLATGCVSILKPAEQTPLSALRMGQLVKEAGFPPGVINILSGFGDVGAYLVRHNKIDKIAFTGSTSVGRNILANSSTGVMKKVTLELGGKSPNIICHDCDLDVAVDQASFALFFNHGQCCCAGSRLYVHESIYDKFVAKIVEKAKKIKLGNPLDKNTDQGPQVSKEQFDMIMGYIKSGKEQGAKLQYGGNIFGNKGYFIEPTVFSDVQDNMKICQEEIFGPVMSILKFKTYDEVIERANDNCYGLGAGIVTKCQETYLKIANSLRTGCVWVNCYDVLQQGIAFGGFKDSGIGRELGELGLRNYIEYKTVIVKMSDDTLP